MATTITTVRVAIDIPEEAWLVLRRHAETRRLGRLQNRASIRPLASKIVADWAAKNPPPDVKRPGLTEKKYDTR